MDRGKEEKTIDEEDVLKSRFGTSTRNSAISSVQVERMDHTSITATARCPRENFGVSVLFIFVSFSSTVFEVKEKKWKYFDASRRLFFFRLLDFFHHTNTTIMLSFFASENADDVVTLPHAEKQKPDTFTKILIGTQQPCRMDDSFHASLLTTNSLVLFSSSSSLVLTHFPHSS